MTINIISLDHVSKSYNKRLILDDISFNIEKGQIVTIVGPNGAGKTTLAKLILGLEAPDKGKITKRHGIKCTYVPQKIDINRNIPMDVYSFLKNIKADISCCDLADVVKFAKIEHLGKKYLYNLSMGQLRKIFLAGALMYFPDLIVLDEPTGGLDVTAEDALYEILQAAQNRFNTSILIISHDPHAVMKYSNKIICINGTICCSGTPEHLSWTNIVEFYKHTHDQKSI